MGSQPWFGEGRFVQHLIPGVFVHVGFFGRDTGDTSSTLIGITCPCCTRVARRIARRIAADDQAAAAAPTSANT